MKINFLAASSNPAHSMGLGQKKCPPERTFSENACYFLKTLLVNLVLAASTFRI